MPSIQFGRRNCSRQGAVRSGGDGVDTYSEPSIGISNKVLGSLYPTLIGEKKLPYNDEIANADGVANFCVVGIRLIVCV